jgi:hypothetical protein
MKINSYSLIKYTKAPTDVPILDTAWKKLEPSPSSAPLYQAAGKVFRIALAIVLFPIWSAAWTYHLTYGNIKSYLKNKEIHHQNKPTEVLLSSSIKLPIKPSESPYPTDLEKKCTSQIDEKAHKAQTALLMEKTSKLKGIIIGAVALSSLALLSGFVFYHIKNGNIPRILCQAKVIWDWDIINHRSYENKGSATYGSLLDSAARITAEDRCLGYEDYNPFVSGRSSIFAGGNGFRPIPPQPGINLLNSLSKPNVSFPEGSGSIHYLLSHLVFHNGSYSLRSN